eukprot:6200368-Pleurochrysis_carterae.AAC.1
MEIYVIVPIDTCACDRERQTTRLVRKVGGSLPVRMIALVSHFFLLGSAVYYTPDQPQPGISHEILYDENAHLAYPMFDGQYIPVSCMYSGESESRERRGRRSHPTVRSVRPITRSFTPCLLASPGRERASKLPTLRREEKSFLRTGVG